MARSSKTGGKRSAAKTRQARSTKARNSAKTKRPVQPATRLKPSTVADKELKEAREQQAATANILKVIASSPSDVQPVFEAIVASANRLIGGYSTTVYRFIDGIVHLKAFTPISPEADEVLKRTFPMPVADLPQQNVLRGETDQIPDTEAGEEFQVRLGRARGFRSIMFTPLMYQGEAIGMIAITRRAPGRFADHHAQLLQTFADQAVIAVENTRLFNETKEALERQTATSNVLQVISQSIAETAPVFESILDSCEKLFQFTSAGIALVDGDEQLQLQAARGPGTRILWSLFPQPLDSVFGEAIRERQPIYTANIADSITATDVVRSAARKVKGYSLLQVPMLWQDRGVGSISISRLPNVGFSDKEVALLKTFADQAVIAIENARLFNETREALERQTATSDVLKIISRSSVELEMVLDTLVQTVARLCRADQVYMFHLRHDLWHLIADYGLSAEARAFFQTHPFTPGRGSTSGRAAMEGRAVSVTDVLHDPEYTLSEGQAIAGYRSTLGVPLFRENTLIGVFSIARTAVDPFTDKEIELASTFADQAVIAIENARLFEELRERQAELRVTFDNMGDGVAMFGADKRLASWNRNLQKMLDLADPFLISRPSFAELFRYLAARGEFDSADLEAELSRSLDDTGREMRYERTRPDGRVIEVRRNPVPDGGFVLIYADITERKRAEEAIRIARDAAEKALRDLQAAQDRLVQTEKLASLGQLTAGIAHEIKNPLNFVNNFAALSADLIDEMTELLENAALDERDRREELDEIRKLLKGNLEKVVQHGKRADSIVKNMLLHSREGSGERRSAEINRLVEESLNLAYHGARAEKPGFSITLKHDLDPEVGALDVYPQEMTRALLNLISNGFYAATRREAEADGDFEPVLSAVTKKLRDTIEIRIRDNGTGIPSEVRERMFDPFFTTKPTGEGTGLGLSITHDIIVKQHGGKIDVETEQGAFTEFIVSLPCGNSTTR